MARGCCALLLLAAAVHAQDHEPHSDTGNDVILLQKSLEMDKESQAPIDLASTMVGYGAGIAAAADYLKDKKDWHQRTWFVCAMNKSQPRSQDQKDAGIEIADVVRCTPQMNFGQELCCARYKDNDFSRVGSIVFPTEQDGPIDVDLVQDGGEDRVVYRVCSQAVNGDALATHGVAKMPVACTSAEISPEELRGNAELMPGEIVLRERLLYFNAQQIPMIAVPRCDEAKFVPEACADGEPKTVVNAAWLKREMGVAQASIGSADAPVTGLAQAGVRALADRTFGGALMTSGSFTMMASQGSFL